MPKWLDFVIGCVLWMIWGVMTSALGISITKTPGTFWPLWLITLVMVCWYGTKHFWEKKDD